MNDAVAPKRTLVIAEDDDDDFEFMKMTLGVLPATHQIVRAQNGEALMELLNRWREERTLEVRQPVIFLDLNMPKKDGREALREIKSDRTLQTIPVIVLTTSAHRADIEATYRLGANAFMRKPSDFQGFKDMMGILSRHWLGLTEIHA